MDDPYKILGVSKTASDAEIRSAYRKLAKSLHPDLNPGKKDAEEQFKKVSAAYDLLSDKEKRARFDRGEIDASGAEKPTARQYYRDFGDDMGRSKYHSEANFGNEDLSGIFGDLFGRRGGGGGRQGFTARGQDARYSLDVDFLMAANGGTRRLSLPDGATIDVTIPAGLHDGQVLRLGGKGHPGFGGGPSGDALIEVHVLPHRLFKRDGNDVQAQIPVTLDEAVLGASIEVPTIKGPVKLKIPANSSSGAKLRLKGRGIMGGDQYVELKIVLGPEKEPELEEFLRKWKPSHAFNPRKGMEDA